MRNKRADLMDNILTVILAVIGLVILVYAGVRLYEAYQNQDAVNAQKTLDSIEGRLGNLDEMQMGDIQIRRIPNWVIVGWDKDESGRPDKCYFKSCICICRDSGNLLNNKIDFSSECQKNGVCRTFDQNKIRVFELRNYEGTTFVGSKEDILKFLDSPSDFYAKFSLSLNPLEKHYLPFFKEGIVFNDSKATNLVELSLYKGEDFIGVTLITDVDSSPIEEVEITPVVVIMPLLGLGK